MKRKYFGAIGGSLLLMLSLCGCGSEPEISETMDKVQIEATQAKEEAETSATETAKTTDKTEKSAVTTTAKTTTAADKKTTTAAATTAKGTATTKAAATTTKKNAAGSSNNSSSNGGTVSNGGGSSSSKTTTKSTAKTTSKVTETTTETVTEEKDTYEIDLNNPQSGDTYTFSDGMLVIQKEGTYHMSGTFGGSVVVDVSNEEKVRLHLDGVGIVSEGMPCIQVDNADKVTIKLVDGSSNALECYNTNASADAAIFSKDDLTIKGGGALSVFCNNEHGIACNDDLEIENGYLEINAEKNGIISHKSIWVTGGEILANGDNCGIRCRDAITVSGGLVTACGGKKDAADRGGIISDSGNFYIEGGSVMAVGMNQTLPAGQSCVLVTFPEIIPKDQVVSLSVDGMILREAQPNKKYNSVLLSDAYLYEGGICTVWLNGAAYDEFELVDGLTHAVLPIKTEETEEPEAEE